MIATFFLIIIELLVAMILQLWFIIFFWGMDAPIFPSTVWGWISQVLWWALFIAIALLNNKAPIV